VDGCEGSGAVIFRHVEELSVQRERDMRLEPVEIYSDVTNEAVMRHPGRRFPGVLVQGDTPWTMCSRADRVCESTRTLLDDEAYGELNDLRNHLWSLMTHYKSVLLENGIPLPFSEALPVRPVRSDD
jgi:hypothetical protein